MNTKNTFSFLLIVTLVADAAGAPLPLREATFSHVINDVKIVKPVTQAMAAAKQNDRLQTPDLVRTGKDSLAELTAADRTITRVGANTVFSFTDSGRTVNLQQGSLLFHSPKGKGGGTIKTGGAAAAVLGTTIMVVTTVDGGFKAIVLEGKGEVRLPNGATRILLAGQMVFVLPNAQSFGPLLNVNLGKLVRGARLVQGFQAKLDSQDRIDAAVERQDVLIASGRAEDTGLLAGNLATKDSVQVVDASVIERAVSTTVSETALLIAMRTDVIISTSILDPKHLFLDPFQLQIPLVDQTTFRGFVGRDIMITAPLINLDGLFSAEHPLLGIIATGMIDIPNSVTFSGDVTSPNLFQLASTGGIVIAPGSTVAAINVWDITFDSVASMNFLNVNFQNSASSPTGAVHSVGLFSTANLAFSGGSVSGSFIDMGAFDININGTAFNLTPGLGASFVDIFADNDITVSGGSINGLGSSQLFMGAGGKLDMNGTSLSNLGFINMSARTVILQNIDFPNGSTVQLNSQNGLLALNPNTSALPQAGFVNYISNVRYNGVPLTSVPHPNITIGVAP